MQRSRQEWIRRRSERAQSIRTEYPYRALICRVQETVEGIYRMAKIICITDLPARVPITTKPDAFFLCTLSIIHNRESPLFLRFFLLLFSLSPFKGLSSLATVIVILRRARPVSYFPWYFCRVPCTMAALSAVSFILHNCRQARYLV